MSRLNRQVVLLRRTNLLFPPISLALRHSHSQAGTAGSVPIAQGQISDDQLALRVEEGRRKMMGMGYHGNSIWVQNICWGDHDQVRALITGCHLVFFSLTIKYLRSFSM